MSLACYCGHMANWRQLQLLEYLLQCQVAMLPRNYARNVNRWSWSKQELRPILTCHPHTRNYTTRKTFCIRKFMTHSCKKIQNCCKFRVHDPSYIFLETFLQNSWINATHMLWSHQYINFYDPLRTLWMYCATECKQQCHTSICHHYSTAPPPV